jgi:choline dehydrogenase-like flavoprotein
MVSLRTPAYDSKTWENLGCEGWSSELFERLHDKLRLTTYPAAHPRDRNNLHKDWIKSAHRALNLPLVPDFNEAISSPKGLTAGVGWTPLSYTPDNGWRSSASVAYIHPILRGEEKCPNLTILTRAWVSRINVHGGKAVGIDVKTRDGSRHKVDATKEVVLCAGAFDTSRLMLLSGLGGRKHLEDVGIPVVHDIPGVGENLQDHPATVVVWDLHEPVPQITATHSDAMIFYRHKPANWEGSEGELPDGLIHLWQQDFCQDTNRLGYDQPVNTFCSIPSCLRTHNKGRICLKSADPEEKPALDFQYFQDSEGYDAEVLVAGIKALRKMAQSEPLRGWIKKEIAPGPDVVSDEQLDKYARAVGNTLYHPACTTKMGDLETDPLAVVDSRLRVRGIKNLRIADAGVFPTMITVNLMLTVLAVGERAAELIAEDAGWTGIAAKI